MGLSRGKHLLRILVGLLVVLLGVACRQEAPPEEDEFTIQTPTPGAVGTETAGAATIDIGKVVEHLKANQLPIGRVDIYNAETDPLKRLGRPGQYVGKAIIHDTRMPLVKQQGQDVISFQNSGAVIETFGSTADLDSRKKALDLARQQFPSAPPEYQYTNGLLLLRLGHVFTPEQAKQYEAAVQSFNA